MPLLRLRSREETNRGLVKTITLQMLWLFLTSRNLFRWLFWPQPLLSSVLWRLIFAYLIDTALVFWMKWYWSQVDKFRNTKKCTYRLYVTRKGQVGQVYQHNKSSEGKKMAPAYCLEASFFTDNEQTIVVIDFGNRFVTLLWKTFRNGNKPHGSLRTIQFHNQRLFYTFEENLKPSEKCWTLLILPRCVSLKQKREL